jgi:hypothetical protein
MPCTTTTPHILVAFLFFKNYSFRVVIVCDDHVTEPCMEYLSMMIAPLVIVCDALCNLLYPFAGMTNVHEEDMI